MRLYIFLIFLFGIFNTTLCASEKYIFSYGGKEVLIPMVKYKNIRVNDLCLKKIKTCEAYKAFTRVIKKPLGKTNLSSIAQEHCKNLGGHPVLLKDTQLNISSFCMFKDKTLIDSWDVYNAHFGDKK